MNIRAYLTQPHPQVRNKWIVIISISLFVALFMILLQPFGLVYLKDQYKSFIILGYGAVTFVILIINLFLIQSLFKNTFKEETWTILKQIIWLSWIIFTIGLGNYLYSISMFSFDVNGLSGILWFQLFTLAIGIIPVTFLTIIKQNRLMAKHVKSASEVNGEIHSGINKDKIDDQKIFLLADNEKDKLEIRLSDLLCIESSGNYLIVYYVEEGKIKNPILRSSLKRIEQQIIEYSNVFKCHRAFIINVSKIVQVKGNSQGYRLKMKDLDKEIPVARNFTKNLREKINSMN